MPIYARACTSCQHEFDVFRRMSERELEEPCPKCSQPTENVFRPGGAPKTGVFPFTTEHLTGDGRPIEVTSLHHLRQLERQYGVVAGAFSKNRSNQHDHLRVAPVQRPGGRDYEE